MWEEKIQLNCKINTLQNDFPSYRQKKQDIIFFINDLLSTHINRIQPLKLNFALWSKN